MCNFNIVKMDYKIVDNRKTQWIFRDKILLDVGALVSCEFIFIDLSSIVYDLLSIFIVYNICNVILIFRFNNPRICGSWSLKMFQHCTYIPFANNICWSVLIFLNTYSRTSFIYHDLFVRLPFTSIFCPNNKSCR